MLLAISVFLAADTTASSAKIPFEFRDGFIWIKVTLRGCGEPLNFLFDSGAQVSVINSVTAQRVGLKGTRPAAVAGVGSTTTGFWSQPLEARAGHVQLPRNYLLLDLSKLSDACTHSAIDGLVGADFFHDRIVQVDFQSQTLHLLHQTPSEVGMQILPLRVRPCGMLVPIQINRSKAQWLRLDTGCASALQWVTTSVRPAEGSTRVAVALTSFAVPVTETTVTLGAVRFHQVPTDLQAKEIFPGEKGLLGNGLLARFETVTIDALGKKLILGRVRTADATTSPAQSGAVGHSAKHGCRHASTTGIAPEPADWQQTLCSEAPR